MKFLYIVYNLLKPVATERVVEIKSQISHKKNVFLQGKETRNTSFRNQTKLFILRITPDNFDSKLKSRYSNSSIPNIESLRWKERRAKNILVP